MHLVVFPRSGVGGAVSQSVHTVPFSISARPQFTKVLRGTNRFHSEAINVPIRHFDYDWVVNANDILRFAIHAFKHVKAPWELNHVIVPFRLLHKIEEIGSC